MLVSIYSTTFSTVPFDYLSENDWPQTGLNKCIQNEMSTEQKDIMVTEASALKQIKDDCVGSLKDFHTLSVSQVTLPEGYCQELSQSYI